MQLLGLASVLLPGVVGTSGKVPALALRFADNTPLQFSDGQYLELAA